MPEPGATITASALVGANHVEQVVGAVPEGQVVGSLGQVGHARRLLAVHADRHGQQVRASAAGRPARLVQQVVEPRGVADQDHASAPTGLGQQLADASDHDREAPAPAPRPGPRTERPRERSRAPGRRDRDRGPRHQGRERGGSEQGLGPDGVGGAADRGVAAAHGDDDRPERRPATAARPATRPAALPRPHRRCRRCRDDVGARQDPRHPRVVARAGVRGATAPRRRCLRAQTATVGSPVVVVIGPPSPDRVRST